MLGGIIEEYFNFYYRLILRMFRIDIDKKIQEEPGMYYKFLKILLRLLADFIGFLSIILLLTFILFIIFLVSYII